MEITENPAIQYILVFQIHLRGFRQDIFSLTGNFILFRMRPASPMVRRKRDFFEWEFTKKMNAVGL